MFDTPWDSPPSQNTPTLEKKLHIILLSIQPIIFFHNTNAAKRPITDDLFTSDINPIISRP